MPLIPEFGRQRQMDLCEFEASLVCRASFRIARATQRNPVSNTHTHTHTYLKFFTKSIKENDP